MTKIRKQYTIFPQHLVYALLISNYLGIFSAGKNVPMKLTILLAGDIETNPGSANASCLNFVTGIRIVSLQEVV